jgi:hypothetical protein
MALCAMSARENKLTQLHYRTCHLCETMCGIEVEHHFIRPHADAMFLLGIIQVIFARGHT